ncbi:MAG: transcriptional repressor LexA [Firmicutes bacterium]|nr:transcriptional repressor LexA [Bacillota bacterium]
MRVRNKDKYAEIEKAIDELFFETGRPPSTREIGDRIGMPKGTLARYMGWMREEGVIDYADGKYRGVSTDKISKAKSGVKSIPVVGTIACGTPALAEENIDSYISISTELLGRGNFFFLKASGDSMIDAGIDDGDLVLVKEQQEAHEGEIVVALTDEGENTLKRFYRDPKKRKVILRPENQKHEDIIVSDCRIQGIAIKVLKDLR